MSESTERKPSDQFAKVYASILDSSIAQNYPLRHFFEDMLKLADWRTGIVNMTPEAISRRINLPLVKVLQFIPMLEGKDDQDGSGNEDGRRIIRLDEHRTWGWKIVNYEVYRLTRSAEERREYNREAKRRERSRKKPRSRASIRAQYDAGERTLKQALKNGASPEEAIDSAERTEAQIRAVD